MDKQSIINQISDLRTTLQTATTHADQLKELLPHEEEPAMHAICNVIRSLIWEVEKQEEKLNEMIGEKFKG